MGGGAVGGIDWMAGNVSGCVYGGTDELASLAAQVRDYPLGG